MCSVLCDDLGCVIVITYVQRVIESKWDVGRLLLECFFCCAGVLIILHSGGGKLGSPIKWFNVWWHGACLALRRCYRSFHVP